MTTPMVKILVLVLTLLAIGVLLHLRRRHIKRKERDNIDIPIFLRGGDYALPNSPGTEIIDSVHIYPMTPKVKKRE
jgi:hypothetical protein